MKIVDLSVRFFGEAKKYVSIERKFGIPKIHPKSEHGVKIDGKVKKKEFLIIY